MGLILFQMVLNLSPQSSYLLLVQHHVISCEGADAPIVSELLEVLVLSHLAFMDTTTMQGSSSIG